MCRALKVLCVAEDETALAELRRAASGAEWELAPGATDGSEALRLLHEERPHVLVVVGPFDELVRRALEAYPFLRVISDRQIAGATVVASPDEVRDAIRGGAVRNAPGGPVRG